MEKNDAKASTDLQQKKENFANRNANRHRPLQAQEPRGGRQDRPGGEPGLVDKPQHNLTEVVFTRSVGRDPHLLAAFGGHRRHHLDPAADIQRVSTDPKLR